MNFADLVGQTLDGKYKIERQLGAAGWVRFISRPISVPSVRSPLRSSHLSTWSARVCRTLSTGGRAAGRLRHPNVVNVTDFGFAETGDGRVAFLVMEYLDGCTLGEILEEENNLPVGWTLDILEQVCSAVQEAHDQGIIHRDLKPDNIWLEPNQRGGYTVKVLDFGIAKLETPRASENGESIEISVMPNPTQYVSSKSTIAAEASGTTIHDSVSPTRIFESADMRDASEAQTAIIPITESDPDSTGTRLMSDEREVSESGRATNVATTGELTRVGAVIGTPLYMSPEQCRGEHLDARSDIYSLGVIAYQMLGGKTPFEGDFTYVMEAHKLIPPPPLAAKKVRKKLKRVIATTLEKNPDNRPQSAEAFATSLRSRSEGIFGLLRRAGMMYTEHVQKFVGITILLFLPFTVLSLAGVAVSLYYVAENPNADMPLAGQVGFGIFTALSVFAAMFCSSLVIGTTTWLVTQILALPLRPVRMRPALRATWRNWKGLIATSILSTVLTFLGYALCIIPGLILSVTLVLVAPVVMMENLRGFAALKRSKALVMRSLRTTTAAVALLFFVPVMFGAVTGGVIALTVKTFADASEKIAAMEKKEAAKQSGNTEPANQGSDKDKEVFSVKSNPGVPQINFTSDQQPTESPMIRRIARVARESLTTLIMLPIQILLASLSAIIVALLYLKTRQAGGESLRDLFIQFEESEHPRKKWQERVRQRLIQSGRITSRPSNEEISS
jgi:serine/threonine protein kinase